MSATRRDFLAGTLGAAGAALLPRPAPAGPAPAEFRGLVPFAERGVLPLERLVGSGLDGRRALDLAGLTPETLLTPSDRFFVRTTRPRELPAEAAWRLRVHGLVDAPLDLALGELASERRETGAHVVECAGNTPRADFGLISAARWTGIPLLSVIERARPRSTATRVLVSGFDGHPPVRSSEAGAAWVFGLDELRRAGAFLATGMNGSPLGPDHGRPLRLLVPGWYGCVDVKWVDEIVLLDEDALATGQMREFAGRTGQEGTGLGRARDYRPAVAEPAALPVRVERWREKDRTVLRVVGIWWGGEGGIENLAIRFAAEEPFLPVAAFERDAATTWSLWSHPWSPSRAGRYRIELAIRGSRTPARRMERGFYTRSVELREL